MRQVLELGPETVVPDRTRILQAQRLPAEAELPERLRGLLEDATDLFEELAEPKGLLETVTVTEFAGIYPGEGRNAPASPLPDIFPQAAGLALFAATVGRPVSEKIDRLFAENDLALGYMLDAVASDAADGLAITLGGRFAAALESPAVRQEARVLAYSPGYCGWHVSGQGRLFARLQPEEIGITLNGSFLMAPLKSISGVLVAGPGRIHKFKPTFPFCEACRTHDCRERMASVLKPSAGGPGGRRSDGDPEANLGEPAAGRG